MKEPLFILSQDDWSFYNKANEDQISHNKLMKEAIKDNLSDLITEESIIFPSDNSNIKLKVKFLDDYTFKFNIDKQKFVGHGNGNTKVGDIVGEVFRNSKTSSKYIINKDNTGEEIHEVEVTLDEIEEILFSELEIPNLLNKRNVISLKKEEYYNDVRKLGLLKNIDKRRTIIENMKRNCINREKTNSKISIEDLRFYYLKEKKIFSKAVIIAMMDISGSMGDFEKNIAKTFYFWMVRFIRNKYEFVEVIFIAHNTIAKEVTETEFFSKGESGGTICSSGYKMVFDIIREKYPIDEYNSYLFHFSDGDNLYLDNKCSLDYVKKLLGYINMFCYGEINNYNRKSTLMNTYKSITEDNFKYFIIKEKSEIYEALKKFFSND